MQNTYLMTARPNLILIAFTLAAVSCSAAWSYAGPLTGPPLADGLSEISVTIPAQAVITVPDTIAASALPVGFHRETIANGRLFLNHIVLSKRQELYVSRGSYPMEATVATQRLPPDGSGRLVALYVDSTVGHGESVIPAAANVSPIKPVVASYPNEPTTTAEDNAAKPAPQTGYVTWTVTSL